MVALTDKKFDIFETGEWFKDLRQKHRDETANLFRRLAEQEELSHSDLARVFLQAQSLGLDVAYWIIESKCINTAANIQSAQEYVQLVCYPKKDSPPIRTTGPVIAPLLNAMADELNAMKKLSAHDDLKVMRRSTV